VHIAEQLQRIQHADATVYTRMKKKIYDVLIEDELQ
jgi:hypothetical protein